eukprot:COSAG01_NODE_1764_length_9275_cov_47.450087_5_plen_285_part_00
MIYAEAVRREQAATVEQQQHRLRRQCAQQRVDGGSARQRAGRRVRVEQLHPDRLHRRPLPLPRPAEHRRGEHRQPMQPHPPPAPQGDVTVDLVYRVEHFAPAHGLGVGIQLLHQQCGARAWRAEDHKGLRVVRRLPAVAAAPQERQGAQQQQQERLREDIALQPDEKLREHTQALALGQVVRSQLPRPVRAACTPTAALPQQHSRRRRWRRPCRRRQCGASAPPEWRHARQRRRRQEALRRAVGLGRQERWGRGARQGRPREVGQPQSAAVHTSVDQTGAPRFH